MVPYTHGISGIGNHAQRGPSLENFNQHNKFVSEIRILNYGLK